MDDEEIPQELQRFRIILHPTRLSILLILHRHLKVNSADLRKLLDISWGTFDTHVRTLVEGNLVSLGKEFVQGSPRIVLFLEKKGEQLIREFLKVWEHLK